MANYLEKGGTNTMALQYTKSSDAIGGAPEQEVYDIVAKRQ